jgi:hypothetical protein
MQSDPATDALTGVARMREVVENLRALLLAAAWSDHSGASSAARTRSEPGTTDDLA